MSLSELPSNAVATAYTGYYVTPEGDVWSTHRGIRKMKPRKAGRGYRKVSLKGAGCADKYVHRLVAETLIPNPDGLPQVNHDNGNKADNAVSNLYWTDQAGNMEHARKTGLFSGPSIDDLTDWQLLRGWGVSTREIARLWQTSAGKVWYQLNRARL